MIVRYGLLYLSTLICTLALDALFLGLVAAPLFKATLGDLLLPSFRVVPAILFYLLYAAGLLVFVALPAGAGAMQDIRWGSLVSHGLLFGLVAYATYDLTNSATLKVWTWRLVLTDLTWGTFAAAGASSGGVLIARVFIGLFKV